MSLSLIAFLFSKRTPDLLQLITSNFVLGNPVFYPHPWWLPHMVCIHFKHILFSIGGSVVSKQSFVCLVELLNYFLVCFWPFHASAGDSWEWNSQFRRCHNHQPRSECLQVDCGGIAATERLIVSHNATEDEKFSVLNCFLTLPVHLRIASWTK